MYHKQYFETIKCEDYKVYNLTYHQQRIARTIGQNIALNEYIYPPNANLLKCKVIYDENGIIDILYDLYTQKFIQKFKLIYDNSIIYNQKTLNRTNIHNLYLQKESADEIIIIKNNLVTDTSIANIAILYQNQWITPKYPLLEGTTKARYIQNDLLKPANITVKMLLNSTKIALLNSMIDFYIIDNYDII